MGCAQGRSVFPKEYYGGVSNGKVMDIGQANMSGANCILFVQMDHLVAGSLILIPFLSVPSLWFPVFYYCICSSFLRGKELTNLFTLRCESFNHQECLHSRFYNKHSLIWLVSIEHSLCDKPVLGKHCRCRGEVRQRWLTQIWVCINIIMKKSSIFYFKMLRLSGKGQILRYFQIGRICKYFLELLSVLRPPEIWLPV